MVCFSEKESYQTNILKDMKNPPLAAKKTPNEMTFPSRDFKQLIKSSALPVFMFVVCCFEVHFINVYKT